MGALLESLPAPADAVASLGAAHAELIRALGPPAQDSRQRRLEEAGEAAARSELLAGRPDRPRGSAPVSGSPGLPAEQRELERDQRLCEQGEAALHAWLLSTLPGARSSVEAGRAALSGLRFATLVADRDGTIVPYFSRYGASVQSAWGALCLTRLARRCSGRALVLTAGPLRGPGILDLAVAPEQDLAYAGSKGREWRAPGQAPRQSPLDPEQAARMQELCGALEALLEQPERRRFRWIGSGLQLKYGQATVARQDVTGSVAASESLEMLEALRRLVSDLDPAGRWFRLEDTGFDVEIHLVSAGGEAFDKGDGVRLLEAELPLGLGAGPALVCGDTSSDVAMLKATARLAPLTRAAFVVRPADPRGDELRGAVREWDPEAVFVPSPEALLLLLDALSRPEP